MFGEGAFGDGKFGAGAFGASTFGDGKFGEGVWQAMEQLRSTFDKRVGTRVGRGDVREAVLTLLAEQPMHGYQIIHEIEERSGGSWKPSAGSVYPTLQLLADEGLIEASESNGRKTYTLTDAGRESVASAESSTPFDTTGSTGSTGSGSSSESKRFAALPKAGVELAQAAAQVGRTGSPEQVKQAVTVLEEARRRLYSILAQD
ncbi:PadR family transcriptional regulator [Subtercola sp. PAMC28395]|uniref:PadR family transcriptional regulator n=1 Tax=Subtercola sp. PAMC28395 TaxID=2846775 RepID=UPI00352E2AA6